MIEQSGAELFMFSTDFPHPEGGRDPLRKFDEALVGSSEVHRSRFFYDNMHELLNGPRRA
jgi:predicted TIM-barrel fold metal-dependent hydrolase